MYPPVDTARFTPGPVGDHYVDVSELMPHKQIEVAIAAFNQLAPAADRGRRRAGRAALLRRQAGPDDPVHRPPLGRGRGGDPASARAR